MDWKGEGVRSIFRMKASGKKACSLEGVGLSSVETAVDTAIGTVLVCAFGFPITPSNKDLILVLVGKGSVGGETRNNDDGDDGDDCDDADDDDSDNERGEDVDCISCLMALVFCQ